VVGASATEREYEITADMVGSFELLGSEALSQCAKKAKEFGLEYEKVQVSGDPVEEILKQAKASDSDCIVMGRMPLGRTEKMVVDSISEEVLKRCDVPVIIVK
jgi:nucleotide-binding universal stress UspA family protein